jgi:hypothetical protein
MPSSNPPLAPPVLRLVRYAMLGAMGIVAAVGFVQGRTRIETGTVTADLGALRIVGYVLCAVALAGAFVFKGVRARAEPEKRSTIALFASALAEAAGMMGGVFMLMGGDASVFALAIVIFFATWTLLPADPDDL